MATGNMEFLQWDRHEVARWIESIGFPEYKACFTENYITGRKLIYVNCASLPRLGVTHFKDMQVTAKLAKNAFIYQAASLRRNIKLDSLGGCKLIMKGQETDLVKVISARVRELLGVTEVVWSRGVADPRRDTMGLFLERKGHTGVQADNLTWQQFLDDTSQAE